MRSMNTLPVQLQEGQTAAQILADNVRIKNATVEAAKVKGGWRALLRLPDGTIARTTEIHATEAIAREHCV